MPSRPTIDTAMQLGLNHPRGPFEWQAELGAERLVQVLATLDDASPSPSATARAAAAAATAAPAG